MTEPRQIDRHQVGVFGQSRPDRLEREQALRPGAQQEGVIVAIRAFGEANRQSVDGPELCPDARTGHSYSSFVMWSYWFGERRAQGAGVAGGRRLEPGDV